LPRHRDHNDLVGNLAEGQRFFGERIVEVIEGRSYTYEADIARQRAYNFAHYNAPKPYRSAPFRTRSLRRNLTNA
jgi:hypothetical protein